MSVLISASMEVVNLAFKARLEVIRDEMVDIFNRSYINYYFKVEEDVSKIDDKWKDDFEKEVDRLRDVAKTMADGKRHLKKSAALDYQISQIEHASLSLHTIHIGLDKDSLTKWSSGRGKQFEYLIKAYKDSTIPQKQRILIYSDEKLNNDKEYQHDLIEAIKFQKQMNFEVKVLSDTYFDTNRDQFPQNTLICDQTELIQLNYSGEIDTTIRVNDVKSGISTFEQLWKYGAKADSFLSKHSDPLPPNEENNSVSQVKNSTINNRQNNIAKSKGRNRKK